MQSSIAVLILFWATMASGAIINYQGPFPHHLIGYWPLDDSHGSAEATNARSMIGIRFGGGGVGESVHPGRGPFNQVKSSMTAETCSDYFHRYSRINNNTDMELLTFAMFYANANDGTADDRTQFMRIGVEWRQGDHYEDSHFVLTYRYPQLEAFFFSYDDNYMNYKADAIVTPFKRDAWNFIAGTFDGRQFIFYQGMSPVATSVWNLDFAVNNWYPYLDLLQICDGDRMSNVMIFSKALKQQEIATLPCIMMNKGRCPPSLQRRRVFFGPSGAIAVFPIEIAWPAAEMLTGISPINVNTAAKSVTSIFSLPQETGKWQFEYQLPSYRFRYRTSFTVLFQIKCPLAGSKGGDNALFNWDDQLEVRMTADCSGLSFWLVADDAERQTVQFTGVRGRWNSVVLSFDNAVATSKVYVNGEVIDTKKRRHKIEPPRLTEQAKVFIGPKRADIQIGLLCLVFFDRVLPQDEVRQLMCLCPGFNRTTVPDFVAEHNTACFDHLVNGNEFTSPDWLGKVGAYLPMDAGNRFDNIASRALFLDYNIGFDVEPKVGPFSNETGSAHGMELRGRMFESTRIFPIPKTHDTYKQLTVSFYFYLSKDYSLTERTLIEIRNLDFLVIKLKVVKARLVIELPNVANTSVIFAASAWHFIGMTYMRETREFRFHHANGVIRDVLEPMALTETWDSSSPTRLVIGDLEGGDRMACLLIDGNLLTPAQMAWLPCICENKGECRGHEKRHWIERTGIERFALNDAYLVVPFDKLDGASDIARGAFADVIADEARLDPMTLPGPHGHGESSFSLRTQRADPIFIAEFNLPQEHLSDIFSITFMLRIGANPMPGQAEIVRIEEDKVSGHEILRVTYNSKLEIGVSVRAGMSKASFNIVVDAKRNSNWAYMAISVDSDTGKIKAFDVEANELTPTSRSRRSVMATEPKPRRKRDVLDRLKVRIGGINVGDSIALFKIFNESFASEDVQRRLKAHLNGGNAGFRSLDDSSNKTFQFVKETRIPSEVLFQANESSSDPKNTACFKSRITADSMLMILILNFETFMNY